MKLYSSFLERKTQETLDKALPNFSNTPFLILFGDNDPMTARHWPERWARETSNSKTTMLPKVRHFTFEAAPEATAENFREWWQEQKHSTDRLLLAH